MREIWRGSTSGENRVRIMAPDKHDGNSYVEELECPRTDPDFARRHDDLDEDEEEDHEGIWKPPLNDQLVADTLEAAMWDFRQRWQGQVICCAYCQQDTGRNTTDTMMKCQDRDESPRSPCWRAADILLDADGGVYREHTDAQCQDAYARACWELVQHKSFARFRVAGKGWREPAIREQLDREWAEEKARRKSRG